MTGGAGIRLFRGKGASLLNPQTREIERVLEERVRPVLRAHGGEVRLEALEEGTAYVRLLGACAGCPSADLTAETGIEAELCAALPELVKRVCLLQTVDEELLEWGRRFLRRHD